MHRFRSYYLYRKFFFTALLTSLLSILIVFLLLGIFFSQTYEGLMRDQAAEYVEAVADRVETAGQRMKETERAVAEQKSAVPKLLFDGQYSYASYVDGLKELWSIQKRHAGLLFIALYNDHQNAVYSTPQLTAETESLLCRRTASLAGEGLVGVFDVKLIGEEDIADPLPTLVSVTPVVSESGARGAVIVGANLADALPQEAFAPYGEEGETLILDSEDILLLNSGGSEVFRDLSGDPLVQSVRFDGRQSGTFLLREDGVARLVSYCVRDGFAYIYSARVTSLFQLLVTRYGIPVGLILLAVTLLSLVFAASGARIDFQPISRFVQQPTLSEPKGRSADDITILAQQADSFREKLSDQVSIETRRWLWRRNSAQDRMTVPPLLENMKASWYYVGMLRIDRTMAFNRTSSDEQTRMAQALRSACRGMFAGTDIDPVLIPMSYYRYVVILPSESREQREEIAGILLAGLQSFYERFDQPCCGSVSHAVGSVLQLPDAALESLNLLIDRFFARDNTPVVYLDITHKTESLRYDYVWEDDVWNAMLQKDEAALTAAIDRFFAAMYHSPYAYVRSYTHQLMLNITAKWLNEQTSELILPYYDNIDMTVNQDTLNLYREAVHSQFSNMIRQHAREDRVTASEALIARSAIAKTQEHYADPNLSTNTMADMLGLSPAYFNRVFRKVNGQAYSFYLNDYRLILICQLLHTTEEPFSSICQAVGVVNETYCYSLFKKKYGMTPGQFRARKSFEETRPEA